MQARQKGVQRMQVPEDREAPRPRETHLRRASGRCGWSPRYRPARTGSRSSIDLSAPDAPWRLEREDQFCVPSGQDRLRGTKLGGSVMRNVMRVSPKKVKHLDEGKHKFKVRAVDGAGNVIRLPRRTSSRSWAEHRARERGFMCGGARLHRTGVAWTRRGKRRSV